MAPVILYRYNVIEFFISQLQLQNGFDVLIITISIAMGMGWSFKYFFQLNNGNDYKMQFISKIHNSDTDGACT